MKAYTVILLKSEHERTGPDCGWTFTGSTRANSVSHAVTRVRAEACWMANENGVTADLLDYTVIAVYSGKLTDLSPCLLLDDNN